MDLASWGEKVTIWAMVGIPFTSETARINALKSVEARAKRKAELEEAGDILKQLRLERRQATAQAAPGWLDDTMSGVREQVDRMMAMMAGSSEAGELDKLATAIQRMVELERVTTMRPAPAPLRSKPSKSRTESATPLEPIAEPAQ